MVYCGKPSTGCDTCRQRRIKCDETVPVCKQCQKSGRTCTGPKIGLGMNLRYLSRERVGKQGHYLKEPPASPQNQEKIRPAISPTSDIAASQSQVDPCHKLPQDSLQEQANAYFSYVYVSTPIDENLAGFTGFAVPLEISREPKHYQLAFEACAMAAFAKDAVDSKHCNYLAIAKYDLALRAIHGALGATAMVHKDATLASILLLALFECINPTTGGVRGWYKHIMGAMDLVKERIRQKSAKQIEHSLFISVRTQMVLYSLVTLSGDDDEVWWPQDNTTHKYTLTQKLCAEASSLGAKAKTLLDHPRNEEYARELVKQCQDHDRRCKNWWESSFANTQHRTAWADRVLGSEHDRFQPLMLWNMLLHARVLLNMSIIRCAACIYEPKKNDYKTSTEYAQAFLELQSLISNITISFQQRKEMISALGGYFMTWPLALMLSSKCLQESQRAVFNDQLKYIGKKYLGICRAFVAPMVRWGEQEHHPFGSP